MNTLLLSMFLSAAVQSADLSDLAGIKGGLIVHVGCKEAPSAAGERFVVQGLCTAREAVAELRRQATPYGRVSIEHFDGRQLPYVNHLVNLLVVHDAYNLDAAEIRRVLAPRGAMLLREGVDLSGLETTPLEGWKLFRQPWPKELDDWTHYLHDPQGTSVSTDLLAGPPQGLRWTNGPFWARTHEHTASMQCMVSANGRIFSVTDEGPTASIQLPSRFTLTARDAFNGMTLWKRPLPDWFNALYPLKSGPGWIPRRLVAINDRVYISASIGKDLLCLDAATGQLLRTYADTATVFELIVSDGILFAAVDSDSELCDYKQQHANCWTERDRANNAWAWNPQKGTRVLQAFEAESGKLLWKNTSPITPMSLTADASRVCFHNGNAIIALDRRTGRELWKSETTPLKRVHTGYSGPRVVLHGDRVLFSPMGSLTAISAKTGKLLWSVKEKPRSGHYSLEDFYVIGDAAWVLHPKNNGIFTLYSLEDGKPIRTIANPIKSFYIHQRCHPGRATLRYQLPPMMGIPVYDMEKDTWANNHWVRGGCIYGIMPANGMVYAPPHGCACYYQSKLNGFNALAPDPQTAEAPPADKRLLKGPSFGASGEDLPASAWPAFRHDNIRSGYARTNVPADAAPVWKKVFGTKLSQPVFANGKIFVSLVDEHAVCALDAATGEVVWRFTAGGRINSPPTLHRGLALFGCADGHLYALRTSDGELAWRFQAAPNGRKLMSYGQLESVWPLSGSVLVQDGRLYAVAGRSMFLDGGLRMLILNPETGELLSENVMDHRHPETGEHLQQSLTGKHMPVAMPDILSSDGKFVFMKSQTFTLEGRRVRIAPLRPDNQYGEEVHLFAPTSFLDDAWHQRTYWIYGRAAGEGWAEFQLPPKRVPYGRILCLDEGNAYSYARDPELLCNCSIHEYRLFSAAKIPSRQVGVRRKLEGKWVKGPASGTIPLAGNTVDWKQLSKKPKEQLTALDYNWIQEEPDLLARAMVLANDRLFVAGPRDVADERALWGRSNEPEYKETMALQAAWFEGKHGGLLQVFSKKDGKKLSEQKLDDLPAFDGLIAAEGSLYMATAEGALIRFSR